jgi:hypothetical protein
MSAAEFNDHPRIRFLRDDWKGHAIGSETDEIPYGVAQQLVRRRIAEFVVETPPETPKQKRKREQAIASIAYTDQAGVPQVLKREA